MEPLLKLEALFGLYELSHREFLEALKEGEFEYVVLIRREATPVELNSFLVMNPELLNDENKSHRHKRYGSALLEN